MGDDAVYILRRAKVVPIYEPARWEYGTDAAIYKSSSGRWVCVFGRVEVSTPTRATALAQLRAHSGRHYVFDDQPID